nr:cytochrome P450 [Phaedon brassicae]
MGILTIAFIVIVLLISVYAYSKWSYSYWKRRGLEYLEPEFFYGNSRDLIQRKLGFGDHFANIYISLKSRGLKCGGIFMFFKPVFMPVDLDLVKTIMQRDFDHFRNHGIYVNEKVDPLAAHLFNLKDEKWRKLRAKLTPTFTSGKMKMMFHTLVACTSGLETILEQHSKIQDPIDIKDLVSRFTTDVIGSVAFGIDCNSLADPDSEFRQFGRKIFQFNLVRRIKSLIAMGIPPEILDMVGFKQMSPDIEEFFMNVVKDTVRYRESNNIYRKDFMQLMLQLKNRGKVSEEEEASSLPVGQIEGQFMTINEVAAQCFVFFIAGFETSATTMTFALLELALNQEIQDKLRQEIGIVLEKHGGELTYDAIMQMSYLDKVVHETLRKHPPVPGMPRVCNKDFKIPGTEVVIEKGTRIHIPFQAIHRDPDYYPDPEKFDPERFNDENKAKRHPFAFLPFGEGPRICIGARFGLLQAKVGLCAILRKFKVTLDVKTKTPIKYSPSSPINTVDGGVWIRVSQL